MSGPPNNSKFITINGVLKLNPNYRPKPAAVPSSSSGDIELQQPSTVLNKQALAIISNPDEVADSSIRITKPVAGVISYVQDPKYAASFASDVPMDGNFMLDDIGALFTRLEIPLGLAGHLMGLKDFVMHFKIDDSGSMASTSNLISSDLSKYTRQRVFSQSVVYVTRWIEVEDRLHLLMDLLAYVPIHQLVLTFLNNRFVYNTSHLGKTPEQFRIELHSQLTFMFTQYRPGGSTPLFQNLQHMFTDALRSGLPTMHYILTDGVPDGGAQAIRQIENLLLNGRGTNIHLNPVTFLSCSNNARDIEWMHESEEIAPFVASLHDFRDEQLEVYNDQGPMFPYSRGLWLLANLAAARDPNGLDAMDMHVPLSKGVMDALLGRVHSIEEYRTYFTTHPSFVGGLITRTGYMRHRLKVFESDYALFVDVLNVDLIPSVRCFKALLAQRLRQDIDNEDDNSEDREVRAAEDYVDSVRTTFANENAKLLEAIAFEKQTQSSGGSTVAAHSKEDSSVYAASDPMYSDMPVASAVPYSSSDYYSYPVLNQQALPVVRGQAYSALPQNNNQFKYFNLYNSIVCHEFVCEKHARSAFTSFFLNIFSTPWQRRFFKLYADRLVYFEDDQVGRRAKGTFSLDNLGVPQKKYYTDNTTSLFHFDLINTHTTEELKLRFALERDRDAIFDAINSRISHAQNMVRRQKENDSGLDSHRRRVDI